MPGVERGGGDLSGGSEMLLVLGNLPTLMSRHPIARHAVPSHLLMRPQHEEDVISVSR